MKKLTAAKYLHYIEVGQDTYIGWNRYWPSIFILNKEALRLLDRIRDGKAIESSAEIDYFLEEFKKYHFIFQGDSDPSKEKFTRMVREAVAETERRAEDFYRDKESYDDLKIVNEECNLTCCYCVNNYKKRTAPVGISNKSPAHKLEIVLNCVDRYLEGAAPPAGKNSLNNRNKEANIFFNGGEILLEWEMIKQVVRRVREKWGNKGRKTVFEINTNLTLLTEEIAEFLKKHNFRVHISIDGYRDAHNKTRKYHDGKGSFDDIIERLKIFRKYYGENSLVSFQGTIEFPEDFSPEEVYKMEEYGFSAARLAPNLLNVSGENARRKAKIMGEFLELNSRRKFQVTELLFTGLKDKVNRAEYRFSFNCRGLSTLPGIGIEINISTLRLSRLCGFVQKAGLPAAELDYDIYNPKLRQVAARFITERMENLLTLCSDCELVGICAGGCVMCGLDTGNRLNRAACLYQREMWKIYVKKAYAAWRRRES
jgi:sulfatase maturation enzyme AslB (radical SAM superfamily)